MLRNTHSYEYFNEQNLDILDDNKLFYTTEKSSKEIDENTMVGHTYQRGKENTYNDAKMVEFNTKNVNKIIEI